MKQSGNGAGREPRSVTILGSTGSVGQSTVDLIVRNPESFEVVALTARRSVTLLAQQARELNAELAVVSDEDCYADLKEALSGSGVEVAAGDEAVEEAASRSAEFTMAAIVGSAGLLPTLSAVRRGAIVGLANKETLVCAGSLMTTAVARSGAKLLPVDSEHNAIFQVLEKDQPEAVSRIILTASGGPFRLRSREERAQMTPDQAVAHPNWDMGAKISVDSATMMNKGLELIEARYLFDLPEHCIEILVHPQSVVHSMVAYVDGSVLAQLGQPDMRTPIAYALAWPRRMAVPVTTLDLAKIGSLTFEAPDFEKFPSMRLAREALCQGGSAPITLNAANEIAVDAFLNGQIGFLDIAGLVEQVLETLPTETIGSLEDVVAHDQVVRQAARGFARRTNGGN